MKSKNLLLVAAMLGMTLQMWADNVNIPDPTFKAELVSKFDTNGDGEISTAEAEAATDPVDVSFRHKITSVQGIEAFHNITALKCQGNPIQGVLDLSNNPKITELNCNSNANISKIILAENSAMTKIDCHSINDLTQLDVSNAPNLTTLYCYNCVHLTSLDVTNNPYLRDLRCYNCGLDVINLLNNKVSFDTAKPALYVGNQKASDGKTAKSLTILGSSSKYNYYMKNLDANPNNVNVTFKIINGTAIRYKKTGDSDWEYHDITKETAINDGDYDSYEVIGYKPEAAGSFTLSYTRTFKIGIWSAWMVPFKVMLNDERMAGLKFAKIVSTTNGDGTLKVIVNDLSKGTALEANTPYVVLNTTSSDIDRTFKVTYQPLVPNMSLAPTVVGNCTIEDNYGTITSQDGDDWYALAADESGFTHITAAGLTLKPFRFLLKVNGGGNQAKIAIEEADPTGIQFLKNIKENDAYYDLMGRRVHHPVKGIYIHQGKKVIIK